MPGTPRLAKATPMTDGFPTMTAIRYQTEPALKADEFIGLLRRTTLGERRPVDDRDRIEIMIRNASVIITARHEDRLVGAARALTDFAFCTYLSDLAVDEAFQRRGIGRELIRRAHESAGLATTLILLSAPQAVDYYPHIGMTRHESCWITPGV